MDGLYRLIDWIVSYRLDRIVSSGLYQETLDFMRSLVCYCHDGTDGLYGALVGRGWYGPTLAGARTGVPPLALEGRRLVGGGGWHQLHWCCKGAEYLCRSSKIIQIDCTQIGTNM